MQWKSFGSFVVGGLVSVALVVPIMSAQAGKGGQVTPAEQGAKSDEIIGKLRQLDFLNRLVPLLLTRAQLEKVLAAVEKARLNVKKTEENEYHVLLAMEPKVTALLTKCMDDASAPGKPALIDFTKSLLVLSETRQIVAKDNEDLVYDAIWPELDKGQKKAMAGSINMRDYDPKLKVEDIKDEDVVKFFIRDTFLNPLAYPIMVKLLKQAMK
jgi:hypothetical protein